MSKSAKYRECPVVSGQITAAECGAHRISRHACPEACAFNPFSKERHAQTIDLELGVIKKWQQRLFDTQRLNQAFVERVNRLGDETAFEWVALMLSESRRRNGEKSNLLDDWAMEKWVGLKNDEQIVMKAMGQGRVILLEVHRVLGDEWIEGVDLLRPEEGALLFCDLLVASTACRFSTFLVMGCRWPHYWRFMGNPLEVTSIASLDCKEVVEAMARHLGAPKQEGGANAFTDWFCEHAEEFLASYRAVELAVQTQWLSGVGLGMRSAIYEVKGSFDDCESILEGSEVTLTEELTEAEAEAGFVRAYELLDEEESVVTGKSLGRLLLGEGWLRLESLSGDRYSLAREVVESMLGGHVVWSREERVDVGAEMKDHLEGGEAMQVPREVLEALRLATLQVEEHAKSEATALEDLDASGVNFREMLARRWLDERVPVFDGKTVREAAKDPWMRSAVVREVKDWIRNSDAENRNRGERVDLNWMWDELGFPEFKFEMPPLRTKPGEAAGNGVQGELKPWPHPPLKPWTWQQVEHKFNQWDGLFQTLGDAMDALDASGGDLVDHFEALGTDQLSEMERNAMIYLLTRIWFCFVPPGHYGPSIELSEFTEIVFEKGRILKVALEEEAKTKRLNEVMWATSHQKELISCVISHLMLFWQEKEQKIQKTEEEPVHSSMLLAILWGAVDLVEKRCRERER